MTKLISANADESETKYCGRVMNDPQLQCLKILQQETNFNYALFLNKFEIENSFADQSNIILNFEIYDESIKKIFGGKIVWPATLHKEISYSVFIYILKMALNDFYTQMQNLMPR